jgi:DNA invertase Pin-like site-specific DNA recombinase
LVTALEEFRVLGVSFVSLREQVDTSTPMGKAMFTIIAAISELERDLIRERVIAGVRRAQAMGKHCGRPRREIDLRAAKALLAQNLSVRQVADMLGLPRSTLQRRLREVALAEAQTGPEVT